MNTISQASIEPVAATAMASAAGSPQSTQDSGMFAALMAAQNPGTASGGQIAPPAATGINPSQIGSIVCSEQTALSAGMPHLGMRDLQQPGIQSPHHDPISIDSINDGNDTEASLSLNSLPVFSDGDATATKFSQGKIGDSLKESSGILGKGAINESDEIEGSARPIVKIEFRGQSGAIIAGSIKNQNVTNDTKTAGPGDEKQNVPDAGSDVKPDVQENVPNAIPQSIPVEQADRTQQTQPGQIETKPVKHPDRSLAATQDATQDNTKTQTVTALPADKRTSSAKSESVSLGSKTSRTGTKEISKKQEPAKGEAIAQQQVSQSNFSVPVATSSPMTNRPSVDAEKTPDMTSESSITSNVQAKVTVTTDRTVGLTSVAPVKKQSKETSLQAEPVAQDAIAVTQTVSPARPVKAKPEQDGDAAKVEVQSAGAPAVAVDQDAVRAAQGKPAVAKFKSQSRDGKDEADSSDDAQESTSAIGTVAGSVTSAVVTQHTAGVHAQAHTAVANVEAQKGTGSFLAAADKGGTSRVETASATVFSAAQGTKVDTGFGGRNQQVEVGFHDGTLGWLSVRAASSSDNGLHLSVTGRSGEAAAAVDRMMPSLQHFLQEHDVRASSVTYGSQQSSVLPAAAANMASSTFSQDSSNASAGDQRSNSSGQQRSGSGTGQQTFSQGERSSQSRTFQPGAGSRYEGSLQENGLLSIRI